MYVFCILSFVISLALIIILSFRLKKCQQVISNQTDLLVETRNEIALLYERTAPKPLSEEQEAYKAKLESQWDKVFREMQDTIQQEMKLNGKEMQTAVSEWKTKFMTLLDEEYKKACASIAFHTVEYKRTITKRRREVSRKTKAQPQKQYRSLDED
jgi:hypothetical protein